MNCDVLGKRYVGVTIDSCLQPPTRKVKRLASIAVGGSTIEEDTRGPRLEHHAPKGVGVLTSSKLEGERLSGGLQTLEQFQSIVRRPVPAQADVILFDLLINSQGCRRRGRWRLAGAHGADRAAAQRTATRLADVGGNAPVGLNIIEAIVANVGYV